jgi:UDP-glucose 4-epimerase
MATKKTPSDAPKVTAPKVTAPRVTAPKVTSPKEAGPTRERRSAERLARPRVLVTGAGSDLGRVLCRTLHRDFDVVGIDTRAFPDRPKDVEHHEVDLRRKAAQTIIKKKRPDYVVHLGPVHDDRRQSRGAALLEATATLLSLVEAVGAKKLVVLSSASLYGPSPTSAAFLTEDAPLLGGQHHARMADGIAVDMMVQSFFWKSPSTETVILRPVHIIGPHLQNPISRVLRQHRMPTMLGFDPMMQLIHEDDLTAAVVLALKPGLRGVFNLTGGTQAPLSRILEARHIGAVPIPGPLLGAAATRLRALRLTRFDPADIVHLKYACLVDGSRARDAMGFVPRRSLMQALQDL